VKRLISLIALCLVTLCACQSDQTESELTVFAAASLTDAFNDIAQAFEAEYSVKVVVNFTGSSTLATQIIEGAAADVFASANLQQMRRVSDNVLIAGDPVVFARNHLIVVVPVANRAGVRHLLDLASENVKIVLAASGVPIRGYVDLIMNHLAADAAYGADFRAQFYENIVSEEDNVRQALAKVILGESDATFVYASDVQAAETRVKIVEIPAELQPTIEYPIVVLRTTDNTEAAEAFQAFVLGQSGQCILKQYGLTPITDRC